MGWIKNLKPGSGDCAVCDCPESVCAACCPVPVLKCETRSASKTRCGFLSLFYQKRVVVACSGTEGCLCQRVTTTDTYNSTTCPGSYTTEETEENWDCPPCGPSYPGNGCGDEDYTEPYTVEILEANVLAALSAWAGTFASTICSAFRNLSPDGTSLSIRQARFKFITSTPVPTGKVLVIHYDRTFTPESGSPSTTSDTIEIAAGDSESAVLDIANPDTDGTETLTMTSYECNDV